MTSTSVADRLAKLHPSDSVRPQKPRAEAFLLQRSVSTKPELSIEEAVATAYREGRADGQKDASVAAAIERERLLSQLAEQSQLRFAEIGAQVTASVDAGIERMQFALADSVARALRPLMKRVATADAIDELIAKLRECLPKKSQMSIRVQGPPELSSAVAAALQSGDWNLELVASDEIDVRVEFVQSIVETRIGDWLAAIEVAP
jgi:flagellar biosynthesis/type III secretory pathway protein FliH